MLLALLPQDAVVRGPNLPPPTDGFYALAPLVMGLLVLSALYWVRRRKLRASARRRAGVMPSFALSVALGNALCELDAMLDPNRPVAMEVERSDCDREADGLVDQRTGPHAPVLGRGVVRPAHSRATST